MKIQKSIMRKQINVNLKRCSQWFARVQSWVLTIVQWIVTFYFVAFALDEPSWMLAQGGYVEYVVYVLILVVISSFLVSVTVLLQQTSASVVKSKINDKKLTKANEYWEEVIGFCTWSYLVAVLQACAMLTLTYSFLRRASYYKASHRSSPNPELSFYWFILSAGCYGGCHLSVKHLVSMRENLMYLSK